MGRTWVLDTETKGTGAQMVPLDKVLTQPAPSTEPFFVPPKRTPPEPKPPEPREPRRFRIVDVATRSVLADDAPARAAPRRAHRPERELRGEHRAAQVEVERGAPVRRIRVREVRLDVPAAAS